MELSRQARLRYSRHLILPEIGEAGQAKLTGAKVAVVGAGGLGSAAAIYLAGCGIGTIGLIDPDQVNLENLHRQVIYRSDEVGSLKVDAAGKRIQTLNCDIRVIHYPVKLLHTNALEILKTFDVVIDASDNLPTRYLVSDACALLGKSDVYGAAFRFEGLASVFDAKTGPCYRCIFPEPPPADQISSCAQGGVLGVLPGVIGLIQATETVKLIAGFGETLVGRLLAYDALKMSFRELKFAKDPDCPVCGKRATLKSLIDYEKFCGISCAGGDKVAEKIEDITVEELKQKLDRAENFLLLDVREASERETAKIEGSVWIPLGEIEKRLKELERYQGCEIIAHCHFGGRSKKALGILKGKGFTNLKNVSGGIDEWSKRIDPSVARY